SSLDARPSSDDADFRAARRGGESCLAAAGPQRAADGGAQTTPAVLGASSPDWDSLHRAIARVRRNRDGLSTVLSHLPVISYIPAPTVPGCDPSRSNELYFPVHRL